MTIGEIKSVLTGDKKGFLAQVNAMQCLPTLETDVPNMMFLTSFNERFEGATVEPATEYGTTYLDTRCESIEAAP